MVKIDGWNCLVSTWTRLLCNLLFMIFMIFFSTSNGWILIFDLCSWSECSFALVLCVRGSAQKLLAPFSRQRVFLLKDSGFIRSSRVTDASWLRLVPSLLHEHLQGCNLNHTSIGHLWHPLFDNLFVMTMFINVFLLKDSGFIWSSQVTYRCQLKSDNLQYNIMGRWVKRLIDQASDVPSRYFFHNFLQNSLQKSFQVIFLFFYNFTQIKTKSFEVYKKLWKK